MDQIQIPVSGGNPAISGNLQAVFLVEQQIEGRSNSDIGTHGCVERQQGILRSYLQRRCGLDTAIEDWPAVFALAQLQVQGILCGRKRASLGIDQVQIRLLAANLAAQQQVNIEAEGIALEGGAVNVGNPPHAVSHDAGGIVERVGLGKPSSGIEIISQQGDDGLAYGQASAGQNY